MARASRRRGPRVLRGVPSPRLLGRRRGQRLPVPLPHVGLRPRREEDERAFAARPRHARDEDRKRRRRRRVPALPHRRGREGGDVSRLEKLGDFFDERTGYRKALSYVLDEPIKGGARFAYVFGSALLVSFFVQLVTGGALMTSYAPSNNTAWASVHYI